MDDTLVAAWGHKGLCHFMKQEFQQAAQSYQRYPKYPYVLELCRRYALVKGERKRLNSAEWVILLKELRNNNNYLFDRFLHTLIHSEITLDERLHLSREIMLLLNPKIESLQLQFNPEKAELDLSGNLHLRNIDMLQNFPTKSLNLSSCPIQSLEGIKGMPLQQLNLANSSIADLSPLKGMALRRLNLAGSAVCELKPLRESALVELDLRDCKIRDLHELKHFSYLRRLIISPQQFTEAELKDLPTSMELIVK